MSSTVMNCHQLSSSVLKCHQVSSSVINCQIAWTCLDSEVFERESLAWREDKGAKPLAFILPLLDTSDEYPKDDWLVVWNMFYDFPYIGNVIIPTDELIFFRGIGQPPTRWSLMIFNDRFPLFDESQEFTLVKTMVYPFIAIPSVHFFEHGQNSTNDGIRHFCDWKVLDLAPGKMPDTCSCAACTVNCFDVTSGYQWLPVVYQWLPGTLSKMGSGEALFPLPTIRWDVFVGSCHFELVEGTIYTGKPDGNPLWNNHSMISGTFPNVFPLKLSD